MSRAKTRRPGTRGGRRAETAGDAGGIPDDLADAAEAALDDLIHTAEAASALRDLEIDIDVPTTTSRVATPPPPPPPDVDPPTVGPAPARTRPPAPPPKSRARARSGSDGAPAGSSRTREPTVAARPRGERATSNGSTSPRGERVTVPARPSGGHAASAELERPVPHAFGASQVEGAADHGGRAHPGRGSTAELDELIGSQLSVVTVAVPEVLDVLDDLSLDDPDPAPPAHELAEPEVLRFAVFEDAAHLAGARSAIVAAGHAVAIGESSQTGAAKIADAIVAGQIDAVLVALPGGEGIVAAALALEPRRPIVVAACAGKATAAIERALAAGADLAALRPHDIDRIAPTLLAAAQLHRERRIAHTARGAELVLRAKLDAIADPDPRGLQPFEAFQRVLELEFKRARRFEYPLSVALFAIEVTPPPPPAGIRGILRARAGNAIIHTIRDIDLATQLDHERFLVLLPYTDLTGAAGVGRRVIAAVAQGDPVVSSGRSFPPRVVGAVAQAKPGEPLSFAKLMKDATRALEQARRDGAELAVQP